MSARENILARIGKARGPAAAVDVDLAIRRHQRGPIPALDKDIVKLFGERAVKLASDVSRAGTITEVPGMVARYLRERDLPMKGVCWPVMALLDWHNVDIEIEARAARGDDLVGITGAFLGIAETGTLMLLSGPRTPAATSLLPETHIAVVPQSRIVKAMEEAWALTRQQRGELPRAVNFVSGPSRTADIEGQLQLGAHGPYRVHVIVVNA